MQKRQLPATHWMRQSPPFPDMITAVTPFEAAFQADLTCTQKAIFILGHYFILADLQKETCVKKRSSSSQIDFMNQKPSMPQELEHVHSSRALYGHLMRCSQAQVGAKGLREACSYFCHHAAPTPMGAGAILNQAVMQFWAVGWDDAAVRGIGKAGIQAFHIRHQHQQVCPQFLGQQPSQAANSRSLLLGH